MSREEIVSVAIPKSLFEIATRLGTVKVGAIEVHLHTERAIVREALARGLKLMVIEREIVDRLSGNYARMNAGKVFTSLVTAAERASETAAKGREALAQLEDVET
jgi:hypothetical protein